MLSILFVLIINRDKFEILIISKIKKSFATLKEFISSVTLEACFSAIGLAQNEKSLPVGPKSR